jgi:hypothetical protein
LLATATKAHRLPTGIVVETVESTHWVKVRGGFTSTLASAYCLQVPLHRAVSPHHAEEEDRLFETLKQYAFLSFNLFFVCVLPHNNVSFRLLGTLSTVFIFSACK